MYVGDLRLCIDDDMSCMMTWLLGDLFFLWMIIEMSFLFEY